MLGRIFSHFQLKEERRMKIFITIHVARIFTSMHIMCVLMHVAPICLICLLRVTSVMHDYIQSGMKTSIVNIEETSMR